MYLTVIVGTCRRRVTSEIYVLALLSELSIRCLPLYSGELGDESEEDSGGSTDTSDRAPCPIEELIAYDSEFENSCQNSLQLSMTSSLGDIILSSQIYGGTSHFSIHGNIDTV